MSLRFSPNFSVTDPASAGFSVSGAQRGTTDSSASDSGRSSGVEQPSDAYGLLPPDHELQHQESGTGLAAPEDDQSAVGQPRYDLSYIQRVVQALGRDPYHFQFSDGLGSTGADGVRMVPVAGGSGARGPLAESTPFEPSINPRAAGAFDALSNINPDLDITGTLEAYRNANDIGAYLNDLQAKHAVDVVKDSIGRMGVQPPTEAQLGAMQNWVKNDRGEAVLVYDQADLLKRYTAALRMAVLERQGTVDLDHDTWKIKTIGKSRWTPEQFVQAFKDAYGQGFSEGTAKGRQLLESRGYIYKPGIPEELQLGNYADRFGSDRINRLAASEGVPEGPGQLLALGRWAYIQDKNDLYVKPDVLMDPGIGRQHILDGKATDRGLSPPMVRQLQGYHDLGVPVVEATTPRGHILVPPRDSSMTRPKK